MRKISKIMSIEPPHLVNDPKVQEIICIMNLDVIASLIYSTIALTASCINLLQRSPIMNGITMPMLLRVSRLGDIVIVYCC